MKHKLLDLPKPNVVFDAKKHRYLHTPTGGFFTSCTTISGGWDKPYLQYWYAKCVIERIKENYHSVDFSNKESLFKFLDYAKGEAARRTKEAAEIGTETHLWIQQVIEEEIDTKFNLPAPVTREGAKNAIQAFDDWRQGKRIEWLASETVVCSEEHRIAGTLDAIARIQGKLTLVDFKTSKHLSASYLLQAAGYDIMVSEMTGNRLNVDQYLIVRIPKDGTPVETITVSEPEERDFYKRTFLAQREAHRFYVYAETKLKERGKMKVDDAAE